MKLSLAAGDLTHQKCDLLLLPVFESDLKDAQKPAPPVVALDQALRGLVLRVAAEEKFKGGADQALMLQTHDRAQATRVLLLGLGARQKFEPEVLRLAAGRGIKAARKVGAATLVLALPEARDLTANVKAAAEGLLLGEYKFDRYKTAEKDQPAREVRQASLLLPAKTAKSRELAEALELAQVVSEATNWARDLVNEPPNQLTPSALGEHARQIAREGRLKVEVLDRARIEKLRMGLFSAVAQGSSAPPVLVHLWYQPPAARHAGKKPVVFVGKAITFDSGGLSLKPTDSMVEMKTDMAGAAAVLGAMKVVARLKPPFPVHAYLGACENMPGGRAYRPGDVLVSRLGKTVEVTNTDAEGRLVLGDVLTWANELEPAVMVDLATLTGACMVALGHNLTGVFGADDAAVWEVLEAAKSAGEDMWRLPISEHQRDSLKSEIADMKNTGERWGGAISAALFLKEYVGETPWVHLDIAGPATSPKERGYLAKGATGVGVRTLTELVRARAGTGS
ncbi:MAG: leucyl aminopeptidase [Deltaproteobacteria bacterium]|nr:leucyl aminopeptidase [Deltaproteobacteria bacterium]